VRVASADANRVAIQAAVPEAVFLDREAPDLLDSLRGTAALLIGPGIGVDDGAAQLLRTLLGEYPGPIVIDADALTLISTDPALVAAGIGQRCVFTPHPGELGRLLGCSTQDVLDDRFAAAEAAAARFGCTVLSKGAPSMVATGRPPTLVSAAGHSGVATGGMGDTLGGIVATFLAGGATPADAAAAALHYAGRAAEVAGRGRGLLPRDVAEALPFVLATELPPLPSGPFMLELTAAR
jgi:NAD(P)H-hydrate epimerase